MKPKLNSLRVWESYYWMDYFSVCNLSFAWQLLANLMKQQNVAVFRGVQKRKPTGNASNLPVKNFATDL